MTERPEAVRQTYAGELRKAMRGPNRTGNRVSIRDTSRALGCSYEHVRKIVSGEPVVSERMNQALCEYLGLDETRMWKLAQKEKVERRFPDAAPPGPGPDTGTRLDELWTMLKPHQQKTILEFAEALARKEDEE